MRRLILLLAALAAAAILLLGRDGTAPLRGARPPTAREAPPALPEAPGAPPDPAVAGLLDLLDTDAPRKDRIVARIAELGGEEAWAGLAARLLDPALGTTVETALGLHAPPAEVEALKRRMLDSPDAAARASIVRILAATADPAHGADVRGLLARERDATVRHGAIGALGRFGDRESADALVELMRSGGRDAGAAHYALLGIRNEGTLREIAIRWAALPAEARLGVLHATERPGPEAVAAAREALADADERLRLAAIGLLARAGDEGVEALLDHAIKSGGDEAGRSVAALVDVATERAAAAGLRALDGLPRSLREDRRAELLRILGR